MRLVQRRPKSKTQILGNTMRGVATKHEQHSKAPKKDLPIARPSSSILLISPTNRILLLQRVNTASSFASAHVFPGGHVEEQDGILPQNPYDLQRHEDGPAYRMAAIRECFEESGVLLARKTDTSSRGSADNDLIELDETERERGRRAVHSNKITFQSWLDQHGATADVSGLVPFTRWLTPAHLSKRYSTQMYIYFLPLPASTSPNDPAPWQSASDISRHLESRQSSIYTATPDGGLEHTAARYMYADEWLSASLRREAVLFPPQFFLLSLLAQFLRPPRVPEAAFDQAALRMDQLSHLHRQREKLQDWMASDGEPRWADKCISPNAVKRTRNRYLIMGLGDAGPELQGTHRKGDEERVLKVELDKQIERGRERPRPVAVCWRRDVDMEPAGGLAKM